jgi:hypothetical protein
MIRGKWMPTIRAPPPAHAWPLPTYVVWSMPTIPIYMMAWPIYPKDIFSIYRMKLSSYVSLIQWDVAYLVVRSEGGMPSER